MNARSVTLALLVLVSLPGLLMGLAVAFGPWVASLLDASLGAVDGPFDLFLIVLGLMFAAPSIVLVVCRRRFVASRVRLVVAVVVAGGLAALEAYVVWYLLFSGVQDAQAPLAILVPPPFAILATIILVVTAALGPAPPRADIHPS